MGNIDQIFTEPLDSLDVGRIMAITRDYWYPGRSGRDSGTAGDGYERISQMIRDYQPESVLNYWYPIPADTPAQRARAFLVKVVRKLVKPVLLPLVRQQNDINLRVGTILAEMAEALRKGEG